MDESISAVLARLKADAEQYAARAHDAVEAQVVSALRQPHASATDIISGRRFLVFDEGDEPPRFVVEAADGAHVGTFDSWDAVVAWHDQTVISPGLEILH
ncbi:MAG TPA: hypothetical protein VJT84_05995 [Gaiellaceae bacterium]|nr:hypothetical protein [Gaiellaceae bacterium]